ncbi:MAG: glucokinase [Geminicoccaceae bacterium]
MTRLVGDIGGTNARFALAEPGGEPTAERTLAVAEHPGLLEAIRTYLGGRSVAEAVLAVATPGGDRPHRLHQQPVDAVGKRHAA